MALLSNLFKPKWQHKDPSVRKTAIASLTDEQTLASIVDQDQDLDVRLVALGRLNTESALERYISSDHKEIRTQARKQRLKQLLPEASTEALEKISATNDLVTIANLTDDEAIRLRAIDRITDDQARFQIANQNPVAKVRLAAAQGIQNSDHLQQLLNFAQGKDKALYRFCKDRLQQLKDTEQQQQQTEQKLGNLLQHAQQLAAAAYSPEYNGKAQLLKQQWSQLEQQASSQQQQDFKQAISACDSLLADHAAEEKAQQELAQAKTEAETSNQQILEKLAELTLSEQLNEELQHLQSQWQQNQQLVKSPAADIRQYEQSIQSWLTLLQTQTTLEQEQENLQKLVEQSQQAEKNSLSFNQKLEKQLADQLKKLQWPNQEQQPALLTELSKGLKTLKEFNQQLKSNEAESGKQLKKILANLQTAIEDGHLKEANKLHQQAQKQLKKLSHQQAKSYQQSFKQLTAQLFEFRDWQGYAAQPKKEALCIEMEALIDATFTADILADKIKALQDQWKQLGPISPAEDKKLWERFKAAADKAYEPCREFFAEVADQRKLNLEKRQALIAQLAEYENAMDWESADWQTVQQTLNAARQSFKEFSPVDRAAHKDSQREFQAVCDAIYHHIQQEYDRNISAKEALIASAQSLADAEDLVAAMETCKSLQADWKQVGLTPMKADQKLWKDFRSACDAVFSRRDEERQAHKAEIESVIQQATEQVEAAEAAAQGCSAEQKDQLKQATEAFHGFQLPKGPYQKLRKRLESAQEAQQQLLNDEKAKAAQQSWIALTDKLKAIALKTSDAEQAESLWTQESKLPKAIDQALLAQAWENSTATGSEDDIRKACINLEILAEVDSPAEDKALRMELQVQRLAAGLGQQGSIATQLNQQLAIWLELNPGTDWTERFNQSLLKLAVKV